MTLRCAPPSFVKTFTRPAGEPEYDVHWVIAEDTKDEVAVQPPQGTDEVVLLIGCDGAWTLDPG